MLGAIGLGNVSNLYSALQAVTTAPLKAVGILPSDADQSSTAISPAGQLYSNLQQLQAKNSAKFRQVLSTIAGQLQTAAQQQTSPVNSQFLSDLAKRVENVANGGDLSQLQPPHHAHHDHHMYNRAGQSVSSTDASDPAANADIAQLLTSINSEVSQALKS